MLKAEVNSGKIGGYLECIDSGEIAEFVYLGRQGMTLFGKYEGSKRDARLVELGNRGLTALLWSLFFSHPHSNFNAILKSPPDDHRNSDHFPPLFP